MSKYDDINTFLTSGGAKSFPFASIGDSIEGTIVDAEVRQQTSMEGELLTWADGKPRMQVVITLQTELRDDDGKRDESDDGLRTIYAKGGKFDIAKGEGTSMRDAIAEAVKGQKLEEGDSLVVVHSGMGVAKRGYQAPKLYTAGFRKAKKSISADALFSDA
jgi:hypothetical protein